MSVGTPPSGLRFGLILTIALIVVSSWPIVVLNSPLLAKTSSTPLPTISTIPSAPSTIGQDGKDGDFTTIKQIGANDIADSSITSTKPNKGFMKRVTLLDNTGGHDAGWDPNGALTDFVIKEPAIIDKDTSFVTIWVNLQTPLR